MKIGFDNEKYCVIQSEHIRERIAKFNGKLYLELGGKLFDDHHASRVLPGFQPDSKLKMLSQLSDRAEIVIVISAVDIEKNKVRGDLGITYDEDVLRLRTEFQKRGFLVGSVVITHYNGQSSADLYREKLERFGIKAYYHYTIDGYPTNVALIDSEDGFGRNDYVETTRPLVIVTAPGPGSGKMAVCLSQLYQEHKRGIEAGYAAKEVGSVLRAGNLCVLESTSPPYSTRMVEKIVSEISGLAPEQFMTAHCPERIIPGRMLIELRENDRIIGSNRPE